MSMHRAHIVGTNDLSEQTERLRCLFCFPASIAPRQLLVATEHFALIAPRGQVREGFLGVFTHRCRDTPRRLRCMDEIPPEWQPELASLREIITRFYRVAYDEPPIFYEQGRGGGTRSHFDDEYYWFHPHLCALPYDGDADALHRGLTERFDAVPGTELGHVRSQVGRRPYLYVHTPYGTGERRPVAYVTGATSTRPVERLRFKQLLGENAGWTNRWDWRDEPGYRELDAVIGKFEDWYTTQFAKA